MRDVLEQAALSTPTYVAEAVFSALYLRAFLSFRSRVNASFFLPVWTIACLVPSLTLFILVDNIDPFSGFLWLAQRALTLVALSALFFRRDLRKESFLIFSFLAGVYLLRLFISALYVGVMALWIAFLERATLDAQNVDLFRLSSTMHAVRIVLMLTTSLIYAAALGGYLFLLAKVFTEKRRPLSRRECGLLLLPCLSAFIVGLLIRAVFLSPDQSNNMLYTAPATRVYLPLGCLLLLATIVATVALLQKEFDLRKETHNRALIERQLRQMKKETDDLREIYADLRGLRHDLRGRIANLLALVRARADASGFDEAKEIDQKMRAYLARMEKDVQRLDFPFQTGNPVTDVILAQTASEAKRNGCLLQSAFAYPGTKNGVVTNASLFDAMDAYDLAAILNNVLENALDACCALAENADGAPPVISLRSGEKDALYFLTVENPYQGDLDLDRQTGLPRSTKEPDGLHGVGLESVRRFASRYLGDVDIDLSEENGVKRFRLTVMLNLAASSARTNL